MPSTSAKQAKFMKAVANNPKFAKKVGVPQSVGKDFEMADKKMKKFGSGGMAKKPSFTAMTPAQRRAYTSDATKYNKRTTELQEEADMYERSGRVTDAMKSIGPRSTPRYTGNSKAMYAKADRLQREVARRLPNTGTPTSLRNEPGFSYDGGSLRRRGLTYAEFNDKGTGSSTPGDRADAKRRRENADRRSLKPLMDKAIKAMKATKKPQYPVRIDLDKAKRDTAARDAAKRTPREEREKKAMEKKYPFNRYAEGGKIMKKSDKAGRALVKKSADTMGRAMKMNKGGKCYAKGGSVSSRADGCATKGKTHTKMVTMRKGGSC